MVKPLYKKWTVLYYANGNNEYEPEMYKSLIDLQSIDSNDSINIVMELGREDRDVASIIRTGELLTDNDNMWTGVRRYFITKSQANLINDLGKLDLSDPKNLYNFIEWGIENFPADHYMLILGGHGASFVGTLTDYSQDLPHIMGTVEMCKAINMILKNTKKKIDILILDICFMNLAEIMYEFGKEKENTVQNIITYIESGPFLGLPYDRLIEILMEYKETNDIKLLAKQIVYGIDLNLIAFELHNGKLKKIKRSANDLAYSYIINRGDKVLTPFELLTKLDSNDPWYESVKELQKNLSSIILCYNEQYYTHGNLINIIYLELKNLVKIYYKLSFAKNNYWVNLLVGKGLEENLNINVNITYEPTVIRPNGIRSLIQAVNPQLNEIEAEKVFEKLISNRKWSWPKYDEHSK